MTVMPERIWAFNYETGFENAWDHQQHDHGVEYIRADIVTESHDAIGLAADDEFIANFLNALADRVHNTNVSAGWWTDIKTGESILHTRNVPEMLCLIHSEISEAMEGHRKSLMDDKLTHRPMLQTELADAIIRILDLAGSRVAIERNLAEAQASVDGAVNPIGDIMIEKINFNRTRADHQIENRLKDGGKKI